MITVVKSSGDIEAFDPNLIIRECIDAGIDFFTASKVTLEVSKKVYDQISTQEIRELIYDVLQKIDREAAERYIRFHSIKVRTSRNTIENFERKKIVDSLLKETNLSREIAENIAKESENELRRLKLKFVSAPLIREIVNVKLLEHGFEEARCSYTRLGLPIYDVSQILKSKKIEKVGEQIFKEYALLKALPIEYADAHMQGSIHIFSIENFVLKPYIYNTMLKDLKEYERNGIKVKGEHAIPLNIRDLKKRFCKIVISDFDSEDDNLLKSIALMLEGDEIYTKSCSTLDYKIDAEKVMRVEKEVPDCINTNVGLFFLRDGTRFPSNILQLVALNLPRALIEGKFRERNFLEILTERIDTASKIFEIKRKYTNSNFKGAISLIGLYEVSKYITASRSYDEVIRHSIKILKEVKSYLKEKNILLSQYSEEKVEERFAKLDLASFGRRKFLGSNLRYTKSPIENLNIGFNDFLKYSAVLQKIYDIPDESIKIKDKIDLKEFLSLCKINGIKYIKFY